jgi:hypothetical protein
VRKGEVERYLLSHLHKGSPYADVAYFDFLALHRMGRTVDALTAAKARLAGDKQFGCSNLLGTLSALVSREYFLIAPETYAKLMSLLEGDPESNFSLLEKINLARLLQIDERSESKNPSHQL